MTYIKRPKIYTSIQVVNPCNHDKNNGKQDNPADYNYYTELDLS